jgi:WD40 repeat protein
VASRRATPVVRRQLPAIDAARASADTLRQALAADLPWQPRWAAGTLINPALRPILPGPTEIVNAVACTHLEDGTPIAITGGGYGRGGGEVIVWDPRAGQQHATLPGPTRPVNAVACTHLEDGTPIAITGGGGIGRGGGGEVIVWDLRAGQQHATLPGPTRPVNAVACTHLEDGTPIPITSGGGIGGADGEVIVWDLRTGRIQQTLAAPYSVGALCCDSGQGVNSLIITVFGEEE